MQKFLLLISILISPVVYAFPSVQCENSQMRVQLTDGRLFVWNIRQVTITLYHVSVVNLDPYSSIATRDLFSTESLEKVQSERGNAVVFAAPHNFDQLANGAHFLGQLEYRDYARRGKPPYLTLDQGPNPEEYTLAELSVPDFDCVVGFK